MKLTADKLARILGVSDVSEVEEVSLQGQHVQDTGSLAACLALKRLQLAGNRFTVKRQLEGIFLIPYLEQLDLSGAPVCKAPKYREYVISHCPPTLTHLDNKVVRAEERKAAQAAFPNARANLKGLQAASGAGASPGPKGVADIFSNTLEKKKKKRSVSSASSLFGDDFMIPSDGGGGKGKAEGDTLESLLLGQSAGKGKKKSKRQSDAGADSSAVGASVFGGDDDLFSSIVDSRTGSKSPRGRLSHSSGVAETKAEAKAQAAPSPVTHSGSAVPTAAVAVPEPLSDSGSDEEEPTVAPVKASPVPPSSIYDEVEVPEEDLDEASATATAPAADDLFAGISADAEERPRHLKSSLFGEEDDDSELFGKPAAAKEKSLAVSTDASASLFAEPVAEAAVDDASMEELFGKPPAKQVAPTAGLFEDPILASEGDPVLDTALTSDEATEPSAVEESPDKGEVGDREEPETGTDTAPDVPPPAPLPDLSSVPARDVVLWVTEYLPNAEVHEELECSYGFVVDGCFFILSSSAGALTVDLAWKEDAETADCVVTCSVDGLLRIVRGDLARSPATAEERVEASKDLLLERLAARLKADREQWIEFLEHKLEEAAEGSEEAAPSKEASEEGEEGAEEEDLESACLAELRLAGRYCKEAAFRSNGMSATVAFQLSDMPWTLFFRMEGAAVDVSLEAGAAEGADVVVNGQSSTVLEVLQGALPLAMAVIDGDLEVGDFPQFLIFATAFHFSAEDYCEFRETGAPCQHAPAADRAPADDTIAKNAAEEAAAKAAAEKAEKAAAEKAAAEKAAAEKAAAKAAAEKAEAEKAAEKAAAERAAAERAVAAKAAAAKTAAQRAAEEQAAAEKEVADAENAKERRAAAERERIEREAAEAERIKREEEEKERKAAEEKEERERKFAKARAEEQKVKEELVRKEQEEKEKKAREQERLAEEEKCRRLDQWYDIRKDNPMLVALVTARVPQCYQPGHGSGTFMFSVELADARCSIVIDVEEDAVSASPMIGSVKVPQCALRCTSEVLQQVLRGDLNVQMALMTGQVLAQTGLEKLAVFTSSFDFSLPVPELDLAPDFSLPTMQEEGAAIPAPARDSSMDAMPAATAVAVAATPTAEKETRVTRESPSPSPPPSAAVTVEEVEAEAATGEPDPRLSHAFHFLLESWKGCSWSGSVLICVTDDEIPDVVVSLTPSDVELLPAGEEEETAYLCELRCTREVLIDLVTGVRDVYQLQGLGEKFLACRQSEEGALEQFCAVFDFQKSRYREYLIQRGLNPDDEFDSAGEDQRLQEATLYIPHCLQLGRVPKSAGKTLHLSVAPVEDEQPILLNITIDASKAKDGHPHTAVEVTRGPKTENVYCTAELHIHLFLALVVGTADASTALMEGKMKSSDRPSALKFFQCFKFLPRNHSKFVKALRAGVGPIAAGQGLFPSR